jgi:hypothetical protein
MSAVWAGIRKELKQKPTKATKGEWVFRHGVWRCFCSIRLRSVFCVGARVNWIKIPALSRRAGPPPLQGLKAGERGRAAAD